jgi:hypothetical protein
VIWLYILSPALVAAASGQRANDRRASRVIATSWPLAEDLKAGSSAEFGLYADYEIEPTASLAR